ncbi:hypothetical protein LINGRAHAP2_LOCUS4086 [Linum grandiflorum]
MDCFWFLNTDIGFQFIFRSINECSDKCGCAPITNPR